jgi:zinc D-Ala-D-Ala carboxypeptidase
MKILTFLNNVQRPDIINQGLSQAKTLAKTIGLDLEFEFITTDKQFTSEPLRPEDNMMGYAVKSQEIFDLAKSTGKPFDVAFLLFNANRISPMPTNPRCQGMNIQMPEHWYGIIHSDVLAQFFLHELCHYFFQGTGKPDVTHDYVPGFTDRTSYYLHLLKQFVPNIPQARWKYFKLTERTGSQGTIGDLNPKLVDMLDKAREVAGIPFRITSGKRSVAQNEGVGGVNDSSHLLGLAVDIGALTSNQHYLITKGLIQADFRRISKKYPTHIHADIDLGKPQDVLF